MSCGLIDVGSSADCENIPEAGTRARLILMNFDDVEEVVIENARVVDIIMKSEKMAYEFLGFRNDMKKADEVAEKEGLKNRFKHACDFVVYEDTQEQKSNLENVAKGRFMAITERLGKGPDSLELLGKDVGLEIKTGVIRDAYENGGLFIVALSTPDNGDEFEHYLPKSFGEDYTGGLQLINDLLGVSSGGDGIYDYTYDYTYD